MPVIPRIQLAWIVALFLGALLIVQTVRIEGFKIWPLSINGLQADLKDCKDGRQKDRDSYAKAQAEAKAKNIEQVRAKEQKQEVNNGQAISNLRTDLERIRRELRPTTGAAKGGAGSAGPSETDNPGGTSDPSCLHLTPEERLRGAEDEARHAELVNLVRQAQRLLNE